MRLFQKSLLNERPIATARAAALYCSHTGLPLLLLLGLLPLGAVAAGAVAQQQPGRLSAMGVAVGRGGSWLPALW
eukprot:COSAG02_NODE_203_length_29261_cov_20.960395_19_plen_75_part_00